MNIFRLCAKRREILERIGKCFGSVILFERYELFVITYSKHQKLKVFFCICKIARGNITPEKQENVNRIRIIESLE